MSDDGGVVVDAGPELVEGTLDVSWIHGVSGGSPCTPSIQTHWYNDDTVVFRQNKCVNFEGPFMYLLFGDDQALLEDTGATSSAAAFPIQSTVEGVIAEWLAARGRTRDSLELVVAHSHAHGDHVQGDGQFSGEPYTTVVGTSQSAVAAFFGLSPWPSEQASYDLGGRVLDVVAIPGHHTAHIAFYDRATGLVLTGDSLYPGFLFISDFATYRTSIGRLRDFLVDKPVAHVLGTHIEMTATPGVGYPYGTNYQPNEHALALTKEHIDELYLALVDMGNSPHQEVHDDFVISP